MDEKLSIFHEVMNVVNRLVTCAYQLVDGDHAQHLERHVLEHGGDPDLVLGLELVALDARNRRMQAKRMLDHLDFAVEGDLADRLGVAQELGLELLDVVVQRLVGADAVRGRVALAQHGGELVLLDQLRHLGTGLVGIGAEIFQGNHRPANVSHRRIAGRRAKKNRGGNTLQVPARHNTRMRGGEWRR
jgi:hypothetical protein